MSDVTNVDDPSSRALVIDEKTFAEKPPPVSL
jgi:hypothetical protein